MEPASALQNTLVGYADFIGDTGLEDGSTMSRSGPAELIPCWKCPKCGYSVTRSGLTPYSEIYRAIHDKQDGGGDGQ
jgi:hypothetical protein